MNGVQLLLIIFGGIAVSVVAHRRGVQPGLIVVVLAAGASFLPGVPRLELDSELILAVVVPPLLYSATRAASFSGFSQNLRPILTLGVTLVVLTTGVAGLVGSWLMPAIGLPAALLLGAVLAPPDTITTVSHGDELGIPRRVTAILTGESLVNDATALTLFGIAAAAAGAEETLFDNPFGLFAYTAAAGVLIGMAFAAVALLLRPRLHTPVLETSLALLLPFTAYLSAEQVHASGILAVVACAYLFSINTTLDPKFQYPSAYRTRLQEDAVWPVLDFLLETFVFAYIGLQLRFVIADLRHASAEPGLAVTLLAAGVLLVTVILFRLLAVWMIFSWWDLRRRALDRRIRDDPALRARMRQRAADRLARRRRRRARARGEWQASGDWQAAGEWQGPLGAPSPRESLIVGWTGMRGILTLAAAAAIPPTLHSGEQFPGRAAIQAIALFVTLGTLLIQGTTISPLVRRLKLDTHRERERATQLLERGRQIATAAISHDGPPTPAGFDAQRTAVVTAVLRGDLDDDTARILVHDIDLRQAAETHLAREEHTG
ncbi:cation:proton antiporter [Dactylosporangium matsuzakiense]|uniref:Sodium/hydrogen exchanger n=1 Tax=Dactylosporangium matsuzakiense TaxID=53360 RepID=A0A9W6NSR4_9ACTN|nr:cation:proton antiporter [Dactylosporangium matsuzakiense]UWZ49004.1 cation:proton antiporter [Dactylosporangium matsuzakiense]GLL07738.1 sodium/hydrogen exchanger [Dactylosporangium matsuzakiense]